MILDFIVTQNETVSKNSIENNTGNLKYYDKNRFENYTASTSRSNEQNVTMRYGSTPIFATSALGRYNRISGKDKTGVENGTNNFYPVKPITASSHGREYDQVDRDYKINEITTSPMGYNNRGAGYDSSDYS